MNLTAERVEEIFKSCLFLDGEDTSQAVKVEGLVRSFGFHPHRLESSRPAVVSFLNELPDNFHAGIGEGWSFLNLCSRRDDSQWGEQSSAELLLCLAIGLGIGSYCIPREFWPSFPGGVPYVVFDVKAASASKAAG